MSALTELRQLNKTLGHRSELRTLGALRHQAWRRNIEASMERAIETSPEEPGPLNSHMLVMKAFDALGQRSPEYLEQWVAYLNDLMWLEAQE